MLNYGAWIHLAGENSKAEDKQRLSARSLQLTGPAHETVESQGKSKAPYRYNFHNYVDADSCHHQNSTTLENMGYRF